ncbi:MAG: serine/threonine protein kinase [Mariniblastus sp.]|jgi:serine/threonine protein kinase
MSDLTAEQFAQRVHDCGLLSNKQLEETLSEAGGRGHADFNSFIMKLLEKEQLTNWQISRVVDGQRRGFFYGNWQVLYLIGAGTFARVYRAFHSKTGDVKAIKVLRQRYSNDTHTREHFLREARMVMKLRHPNIVPIGEVDEDKGRIYMVMDFVEGQNLREYVKAHKVVPNLTTLRIVRDILAGLAHAATKGIYHRDMKLSNVLLSAKGQAKLVDFGLATVSGGDEDETGGGPRSIDYAGLERCTGVRRNDPRSDIYFVGCMLYQMITGIPPLEETRERIRRLSSSRFQGTAPMTVHRPDLPHRIVILCNRLMDIDPERRIQTAELAFKESEAVLKAIESGDNQKYDSQLTEKEAREYADLVSKQEEGRGKTLLLIESNVKVQDSLRDRLKKIGYRVLITGNPERGLSRFNDLDPAEDSPADCVIFGCAGLGREAVSWFERFTKGEFTAHLPAILIVTDKLEKLTKKEWMNDHRAQLSMPVKFKHVQGVLRSLLKLDDEGSEPQPTLKVGAGEPAKPVSDRGQDTDVELD